MTNETKQILIKRTKSFLWRLGAYTIVAFLNFAVEQLGLFDLNPTIVTIIALVCGEITKYLNTNRDVQN